MRSFADITSFLRAISAEFDQDVPRLVFADYLEESGDAHDTAWAEFIRLQCEQARIGVDEPAGEWLHLRIRELEPTVRQTILNRFALPTGLTFTHASQRIAPLERGFPSWISAYLWATLRQSIDSMMIDWPIRKWKIGLRWGMREVRPQEDYAAEVVNCGWTNQWLALDLGDCPLSLDTLRILGHLGNWQQLRELWLPHIDLEPAMIPILATWKCPALQRLELANNYVSAPVCEALIQMPLFAQLHHLGLAQAQLSQRELEILFRVPNCPNLTELVLDNNSLGDNEMTWLFRQPSLPQLRSLSLVNTSITNRGIEQLSRSTMAGRLRKLNLSSLGRLSDDAIEAIAEPHRFNELRELHLAGVLIDDSLALLLRLPRLQTLTVSNLDRVSPRNQRRLRERFGKGLIVLDEHTPF